MSDMRHMTEALNAVLLEANVAPIGDTVHVYYLCSACGFTDDQKEVDFSSSIRS